ncbi:MAG: zinc ABC transporter substrate-binding protein [Gammaproteobacteria bacterium]|nr:zinc ABC transporter substrate-binding protein [Gammaproteobacteria bacterium]MYD80837.1 zinc ABC transporter substrate-binding protein [Gammaproteobacteria bacterium]
MNNSQRFCCVVIVVVSIWFSGAQCLLASELKIVASIAPIHSLVSEVVAGTEVREPELLVRGKNSPHAFTLRPSDVRTLQDADIFFLVSETLETFAMQALKSLENDTYVVELMNTSGLHLVQYVESESKDTGHGHAHEHGHIHTHDGSHPMSQYDHHIWLDPGNAIVMVAEISRVMSNVDPDNSEIYESNANRLRLDLEALTKEMTLELKTVQDSEFIVFHDAYKTFEHRFGLTKRSHPILVGENRPGARRMQELRNRLKSSGVRCVFKEPQYDAKILDVLVEGTDAKIAELDPLGINFETGTGQYFALMRSMVATLRDCLAQE